MLLWYIQLQSEFSTLNTKKELNYWRSKVFQKDQVSHPISLKNEKSLVDAWDIPKLLPRLASYSSLTSFVEDTFHNWVNFSLLFSNKEKEFLHFYLFLSWKFQKKFLKTFDWKFTLHGSHCWSNVEKFIFQNLNLGRHLAEVAVPHFSSSIWTLSWFLSSIWQASNRTKKRKAT